MAGPKRPKLRGKARALASKYIAYQARKHEYPRKQAIAIGISQARRAAEEAQLTPAHRKLRNQIRELAAKVR